jgi:hypothetical protein
MAALRHDSGQDQTYRREELTKMATVAAHQPNYIPWAGYFYKMLSCDDFVFGDDLVMSAPSFINRNRIKTKEGVIWLTLPCRYKVGETLIKDVQFADDCWRRKHLSVLTYSYKKAPYFDDYMPRIREIMTSEANSLCDLNLSLIKQIALWLNIDCKFRLSSELAVAGAKDDRIVNFMRRLGGRTYLSGLGGANYQSETKFKDANLDLVYYDFRPPVYPQLWGQFQAGLSVIDLLFNCGPESQQILRDCGNSQKTIPQTRTDLASWRAPSELSHCSPLA